MTYYACLKIVSLSLMLLLMGIITSHSEAFLCKSEAAIKAKAYVESPLGILSLDENQSISAQTSEIMINGQITDGEYQYLLFSASCRAVVTIDIDSVRTDFFNLNKPVADSIFVIPMDYSNIRLLRTDWLFNRVSPETKTITVTIIYSEN